MDTTERRSLLRQAQKDAKTSVVGAPRLTTFSGQRTRIAIDLSNPENGIDIKLCAFMVGFHDVELDTQARIGKNVFSKHMRVEDDHTFAQFKLEANSVTILLMTPRIQIHTEDVAHASVRAVPQPIIDLVPQWVDRPPGANVSPVPHVWVGDR